MIDEILDFSRLFTEWPSGTGPRRREKLIGQTRAFRWTVAINRILRILCIPLGVAGFFFLGDDTPWRFIAFSGGAMLIAAASFGAETVAIRRGLVRIQELPKR
jgi:hypothetical protein